MPNSKTNYIVHISTEIPMGGGEWQLLYLYFGLEEKHIPQIIICSTDSALEKYCKNHGLNYIALDRRGSFSPKFAWELKKVLTKLIDEKTEFQPIIHCHDAHAHTHAILVDALNLHKNPIPCVVGRKVVPSRKKNKWLNILKYNYPTIKKYICVSKAIADICKTWIRPKDHCKNKLIVLHDTIMLKDYLPPKTQPKQHFTIGVIASLIPVKNHTLFLDCAKKLLNIHTSFEFWLIGEGPLHNKLVKQAKALNLESHVKFLGFREDIPEILSQLDLLFVTSKNEGLCSTILQAMAAQVPVIAKNVGGIPEIIEHKKTGLLAKDGDDFVNYTLELQNNPAFGKELTKSALAFIQDYDLSVYTEKMLAIYQSISE